MVACVREFAACVGEECASLVDRCHSPSERDETGTFDLDLGTQVGTS